MCKQRIKAVVQTMISDFIDHTSGLYKAKELKKKKFV